MGGALAAGVGRAATADRELVDLAASGDRDAFDALIRPRLERLYRMTFAITRNQAEARDATQEACVQAWRELARLRDRDRFDSWLSQIAVNAGRGRVRMTARRQVRELSVDRDPDGDALDRRVAEPSVPPETDAFAEGDAIRRAFARLDGTTRALLVLHYVEGTPLGEIARATGSPVGTVKWRLSNARRALERALEAERR